MGMDANVKSTSTRPDGRYERFLAKAEGYLHKYQASHSSPASGTPPVVINGDNGNRTRHLEFFKKAQGYLNNKDKENKKDKKDKKDKKGEKNGGDHHENSNSENEGQHDHKEHLKLAHAMLKKIKKHKERHGKQNEEEQAEEEGEIEEEEEEEEKEEEEEEEESHWFKELMEGVQEFVEGLNEE